MCHNSSTCHVYVLCIELGHSHFSKRKLLPLEMGTSNATLQFGFCLAYSLPGSAMQAKNIDEFMRETSNLQIVITMYIAINHDVKNL